jgi:uncharacterized OB-fold protein
MTSGAPLMPRIDETNGFFWEGTRQGELRVQRCSESGRLIFPPRVRSPWSRTGETEWVVVSGRGTLWSFVLPHPPLIPQFSDLAPYNVILVALDEDPAVRMVGNLVSGPGAAINSVDPEAIAIGAGVQVVFEAVSEEVHMPRWVLT